jgi:hypothetical protein
MIGQLDSYSHRSRIQPAFLGLLPATVTLATTMGFSRGLVSGIIAVAGSTGLTYLIAMFVRDRGRRIQKALWASWGGKPTTQLLKMPLDETEGTLQRRRALMRKLMSESSLQGDQSPPSDDAIEDYVGRLRELTRDRNEYPLVAHENAGYGFRRNLLGLRRLGIALSALSTAWAAVATGLALSHHEAAHATLYGVVLVGDVGAAFLWVRVITGDWVKEQAFHYARALFGAAEKVEVQSVQ